MDLQRIIRAFVDGHLTLLLIVGPPGIGKSKTLRNAIGNEACWIDGNASAFGIYKLAYCHANEPIVLDDVDSLCRDRQGIRLLKALCQTEPIKRISWETNAPSLESEGIPRNFSTSSKVAIITNEWLITNADDAALQDRAHIVTFEPSPEEVHEQAGQFFQDKEILDFVEEHIHLVVSPSLRTYVLAAELKDAGLDWKHFILGRCLSGLALEVAKLRADRRFSTEEERAKTFVAAGHGCRATYFNHSKRLVRHASPQKVRAPEMDSPPINQPLSPSRDD